MPGFFNSLLLSWKASHIVSEWVRVLQSCWCHLRKNWCHQQSLLFWFLGLLFVHLEYLVIITETGGDFVSNNMQKHGEQAVCKTTYMTRVKWSEKGLFIFIFRLNIVPHDLYQLDKFVMEMEEWKCKKFQATMSKALAEFYKVCWRYQ